MRRILIATVLFLATPAVAQVDPTIHKQCKDAKDYAGCVKAFTAPPQPADDGLSALRGAMKQVAGRIRSGFSLRDSTLFFQPLTDQLSLVRDKYPDSLAVKNASKSSELFDVVQSAWQARISTLSVNQYFTVYSCEPTKKGVELFNQVAGTQAVAYSVKGGLFGLTLGCQESVGTGHESMMLSYISGLLESGSVSPEEIAAREKAEAERKAKIERRKELCAMEPWNRYLEENPNIKAWAKANPKAAEAKMKKFVGDPKNQKDCSLSSGLVDEDLYGKTNTKFFQNPFFGSPK
jgi:hypothetical protein